MISRLIHEKNIKFKERKCITLSSIKLAILAKDARISHYLQKRRAAPVSLSIPASFHDKQHQTILNNIEYHQLSAFVRGTLEVVLSRIDFGSA